MIELCSYFVVIVHEQLCRILLPVQEHVHFTPLSILLLSCEETWRIVQLEIAEETITEEDCSFGSAYLFVWVLQLVLDILFVIFINFDIFGTGNSLQTEITCLNLLAIGSSTPERKVFRL